MRQPGTPQLCESEQVSSTLWGHFLVEKAEIMRPTCLAVSVWVRDGEPGRVWLHRCEQAAFVWVCALTPKLRFSPLTLAMGLDHHFLLGSVPTTAKLMKYKNKSKLDENDSSEPS